MYLVYPTHTHTRTPYLESVYLLEWKYFIIHKWHFSAYSTVHHSSCLHFDQNMMSCEEDAIFKHIINKTLSRAQNFKKLKK